MRLPRKLLLSRKDERKNKSKDFSKNMLSNLWTLRRSENKGACQSKKTGQETQKKESRE